MLLVCGLGAGGARAEVVRLPDGHLVGIMPKAGAAPATSSGARAPAVRSSTDNGEVDYDKGGPVLHSSAPYLIFWDPPSLGATPIPSSTETLLSRYFTDVAHDSGLATNDFGVIRQYSDQTGIADYAQTFSDAQVIVDTDPYPTPYNGSSSCPDADSTYYPICLSDAVLQSELTHLITADGLPTDGSTSASELVANAPIYFIVTPANVDICQEANPQIVCADGAPGVGFCSYHDYYTEGANYVLYAAIPLINAENSDPSLNPKDCQDDDNSAIQEPNRVLDPNGGDVVISYVTHEDIESITDPLLTAWYDPISRNEIADNCNYYGTLGPTKSESLLAFAPPLGGLATPAMGMTTGTLYNQLDNGDQYYAQTVWSNGDVNCRQRPSGVSPTPSFTAPSGTQLVGSPVSFDPSASSSTGGYSSVGWDFGDGATSFTSTATTTAPEPTTVSHAYAAPGTYTVTLTLVDPYGDLARTSHTVTVFGPPTAAFSFSPVTPLPKATVVFNGSGSSDPNSGGSSSSYSWSFGDGTTGTGATPSHVYNAPGLYTVQLTVTDNLGLSSTTTSETVEVLAPLSAAFAFSPAKPVAGGAVAFNGRGSKDPNTGGSISRYRWSFGDGRTATGVAPSHRYKKKGVYKVELTVTDNFGISASTTHVVTIAAAPSASHLSLTGVGRGQPKLTFRLTVGKDAPSLTQTEIELPAGLSFAKKGLAKGVRVVGAGAKKLRFAPSLSHGRLTIKLKSAAGMCQVTISGAAMAVGRTLERKVVKGKVKTLAVDLTAVARGGQQTKLTTKLKV